MSASAWRSLLLAFCAVFMLQEAMTIYLTQTYIAYENVSVAESAAPMRWVLAVDPNAPGYAAGLRDGDTVDASLLSPAERLRLFTSAFNVNEKVVLPVERAGRTIRIALPRTHFVISWELWFAIFAGFWAGACAIVLVLRKPESREVRLLVLWLLLMRLNLQMNPTNWVTPWPFADLINGLCASVAGIGWGVLASYSASFVERQNRTVRVLVVASYLAAGVSALLGAGSLLACWFGFTDPGYAVIPGTVLWVVVYAAPIVCGLVVLSQVRGSARERLAWTLLGAGIYAAILTVYNLGYFWPAFGSKFFLIPAGVLQIVSPAILTYAMLNRRLLDIGFALNRAAVFTGVSVVVIGVFVLVEWAFGEWFASATHAENAIASGGLALILGLSIRAIHHRVDRVLDSLFFRKRHEDEQALRAFAHEAPYVTDLQTLLARTQTVIGERADASHVTIALYGGKNYGGIDENDEAIVFMRAHHRVLDLHKVNSALRGEFAFPMVARGRLVGVIVVGPKRSGESYAPDESAAIRAVASAVGASVDVLSRGIADNETILEAIRSLQSAVAEMVRRMDNDYREA